MLAISKLETTLRIVANALKLEQTNQPRPGDTEDFSKWISIANYDFNITPEELKDILEYLKDKKLINLNSALYEPLFGRNNEIVGEDRNAIIIDFDIIDLDGLKKLYNQLNANYPKLPSPLIRPKALELIAKEIGEISSGQSLKTFLTDDCCVPKELVIYPNTKWRMVYDAMEYLAYSAKVEHYKSLFSIIEKSLHPLEHNGSEQKANELKNKFNSWLKFDGLQVSDDGKLYSQIEPNSEYLVDKDGHFNCDEINQNGNRLFPISQTKIASLFAIWRKLIKTTKKYIANNNAINDDLNFVYFEIIKKIEDILNSGNCGKLYSKYKKPFKNLSGFEYEVRAQGKTVDDILTEMQSFLGEITEVCLPTQLEVEKAMTEFSDLFGKIDECFVDDMSGKITPATMILFDEEKSTLTLNGKSMKIPEFSNEFYMCKEMINLWPMGERVSWDALYKSMQGIGKDIETKTTNREMQRMSRCVYDAMRRINKKVRQFFDIKKDIFRQDNNCIVRNF